jgi:hypothetical protein
MLPEGTLVLECSVTVVIPCPGCYSGIKENKPQLQHRNTALVLTIGRYPKDAAHRCHMTLMLLQIYCQREKESTKDSLISHL